MQLRTRHLLMTGVAGLAAGMLISAGLDAQVSTPGVQQTFLLQAPLKQVDGKRIDVFIGTFRPGARTPMHRHPGTELLYVLEGEGEMIIPGRDNQPLREGEIVMVEPLDGEDSFVHLAVNRSATKPMKNLVIVIHDEGTPLAVPVDESTL